MLRFLVRRLGFVLVVVIASSVIIFVATQVMPGDLTSSILGKYATQEATDNLRQQLGLDKPAIVQYGTWLGHFIRGDWGYSVSTGGAAVRQIVLERFRNSLMLAGIAFLMHVPLGILLGTIAARKRNSWVDNTISIASLSLIGLPEFVIGLILIAVFSLRLGWLPAQSAIPPDAGLAQALPYLILPSITVAATSLAYVVRMSRSSTVDVLNSDYVRTAYLKGLAPHQVIVRHVLRNSLPPTVTIVAMGIGWLIGGLVVTEAVFGYPGLGRLLLFAIQRHDLPLIQASALLIVAIYGICNLVADVVYAYLNPRIRYA